jgi:hypothetical protein
MAVRRLMQRFCRRQQAVKQRFHVGGAGHFLDFLVLEGYR